MAAKDFFLGKRIAVVGIGPHGEMIPDIRFLVRSNALVSVYDMRAEARLVDYSVELRELGLANWAAGSVPADDLLDMDLIILSHEYPRDSSFLHDVIRKGVAIEYPETLFVKLAPPVTVAAVMGSCGKATVTSILSAMLEESSAGKNGKSYVVDPESEDGMLSHLKQMRSGDVVVMRIVESMMPEIADLGWSPHTAVFTTVPPKGSFKDAPFEILAHQTYGNHVVGSDKVIDALRAASVQPKAKMLRTKPALVPEEWGWKARSIHERENAALALQAARLFKVSDETARAALLKWKPLKGRLEPVKKVKNVEFINDAASRVPDSTQAAMEVLSADRNLIVIVGGADSGADPGNLIAAAVERAHTLIVMPGSGTLRARPILRTVVEKLEVISVPSVEEAVRSAMDHARKGDKVLYSPAFEAGGVDGSRRERGEKFVRAVRAL